MKAQTVLMDTELHDTTAAVAVMSNFEHAKWGAMSLKPEIVWRDCQLIWHACVELACPTVSH